MTREDFQHSVLRHCKYIPTEDQWHAIGVFTDFLCVPTAALHSPLMLLRGSAGTGKTSIVAAMVKTLLDLEQRVVLLAPTGRAAKVLAQNCQRDASTIHRKIYRQKSIESAMTLNLDINLHTDTLFVVDEASMISTTDGANSTLLDDLIMYVYSGRNCRLMLVGDTAQLPPIGEQEAPALQNVVLEGYGLRVMDCDLQEVVRQQEESGILWNAVRIRSMITHDDVTHLPRISVRGFADIKIVEGSQLIEALEDSYATVGTDDTVVVTRSNRRANVYNNGIRVRVMEHEGLISSGDRIMVVKNKYLPQQPEESKGLSFIANGDMAVVRRVRRVRELYGFQFADLTLRFPDYDDSEMEHTVLLDTLQTEVPALTAEQQQQLFEAVMADYAHLPRKADRLKAVREDTYYNALQIKFAYAITCHKAQGGQWSHVYVDQGYMTDDMLTPDYVHWLYTAFTRATDTLFLVNWPKEFTVHSS